MNLSKMFHKRYYTDETGRSMVEMLGVIAVIGVLSVIGLRVFIYAMNSYKAYRIVDGAQQREILAHTRRRIGQNPNAFQREIEKDIMNYKVSYDGDYELNGQKVKRIEIKGFNLGVCNHINRDRMSGLKAIKNATKLPVRINNVDIDSAPVCKNNEENTVEFFEALPSSSMSRPPLLPPAECIINNKVV